MVYVAVFFGNYQLTGKWPYAFMDVTQTDKLRCCEGAVVSIMVHLWHSQLKKEYSYRIEPKPPL